jgi:hypothetical protein
VVGDEVFGGVVASEHKQCEIASEDQMPSRPTVLVATLLKVPAPTETDSLGVLFTRRDDESRVFFKQLRLKRLVRPGGSGYCICNLVRVCL